MIRLAGYIALGLSLTASTWAEPPKTPAAELKEDFASINRQVLDMAKDFPADKYDYKLRPEMRSFGAVIVHIASGNVYAAKAGRGENVKWDELDPANYKTKAQAVALLEKSITDATATLTSRPTESFQKSVEPWVSIIEHAGEHYGLLVAYYRANGMVPPASRKK
jgi:hypothetical protein